MNEKNRLKILVGTLCAVLLILAAVMVLMLDSQSPDPILGVFQTEPTDSTEEPQPPTNNTDEQSTPPENQSPSVVIPPKKDPQTDEEQPTLPDEQPPSVVIPTEKYPQTDEEQPTPPEEQPPSVVIPPEKDPQTGEEIGISFPCQIPGYDLTIEKMAPYNGMFVEDGSNAISQNVAMLLVKNNSDFPVEYTQIRVACGQEELLFDISALPEGEQLVVQEKTGKTISAGKATSASALVVQRANMEMSESEVQVTDNGDNTLTVKNLTNETIPTVRVFYKYYMEDEKLFVGGIAFTVRISRLGAGASVTIQPSHYTSQTSRVVMVLTYDSEV